MSTFITWLLKQITEPTGDGMPLPPPRGTSVADGHGMPLPPPR
jgi:hypothetical protein